MSTVSSSITGATCLTGIAERRATAGRTLAAGAKAEHEAIRAKRTQSFMSVGGVWGCEQAARGAPTGEVPWGLTKSGWYNEGVDFVAV